MNTNIISKYLQLLRKKHNYTQDELAKRLDISRQAVSKWETGAAIPDVDYKMERNCIGRVRVDEVERIQQEIVSVINLRALDSELL